jgi:hypothetical protein
MGVRETGYDVTGGCILTEAVFAAASVSDAVEVFISYHHRYGQGPWLEWDVRTERGIELV